LWLIKEGNLGNVMSVLSKMIKLSALNNNFHSLRSIYQGTLPLNYCAKIPPCGIPFVVGLFIKPKLFVFAEGRRWISY
jgi:hypothetical protein